MRKERNPMGIQEAEYIAKRQALLDMLKDDPQRAAVFMLLENMWELEQTPGETHNEIGWEHGSTTRDYLLSALNGYPDRIPVAEVDRGYTPFSWKIRKPSNSQEYEWYDMRIMHGKSKLALRANLGNLGTYRHNVVGLVDQIPYPILVLDRYGFRFENAAMRVTQQT